MTWEQDHASAALPSARAIDGGAVSICDLEYGTTVVTTKNNVLGGHSLLWYEPSLLRIPQ